MSEETSINGGADLGTPEAVLGPEEAAAIMREQGERAQQAFRISHRGSFVGWGLATLVGYGIRGCAGSLGSACTSHE